MLTSLLVVLPSRSVAWLGLLGLLGPLAGGVIVAPAALATATVAEARVPATVDPGLVGMSGPTKVIVQAAPGHAAAAAATAKSAGATVGQLIPLIDGFAATVDPAALTRLSGSADVRAITLDRAGHFTGTDDTSGLNGSPADPSTTPSGSPFNDITGATKAWSQGITGQGVGVAVLDTGTSEMNDLKGRIVYGPDLSGEMRTVDTYGHGTVMSGIIAGNGTDAAGRSGVAP
jgi:serine protease AprX